MENFSTSIRRYIERKSKQVCKTLIAEYKKEKRELASMWRKANA